MYCELVFQITAVQLIMNYQFGQYCQIMKTIYKQFKKQHYFWPLTLMQITMNNYLTLTTAKKGQKSNKNQDVLVVSTQ